MTKQFKTKFLICLVLLFIFIFPILIVSSATNTNYEPMENLPGYGKEANFAIFISNLYKFGIWTVGICALIMIVIGGYMYAASGGNNASMEKAKGFITDALIGLVLALLAYLILYIINPKLVEIKLAVAVAPVVSPAVVGPPPSLPPAEKTACSSIKNNQKPGQCADASSGLNNLLDCMNKKFGDQMEVSSISDGNGGVNCYQNNPTWIQCTPSKQTYCCFHTKNSCHYGGTSGGKSCAVDFSKNSKTDLNTLRDYASASCGAGYANIETAPVHLHVSVSGCGCN